MAAKIVIVGCGSVGGLLAERLTQAGHEVLGIRRRPPEAPTACAYFAADITVPGALKALPLEADAVLFMAAPGERSESAYRAVYEFGLTNVLARLGGKPWFFVSSTAVYGQDAGEWVDEDSPAEASDVFGQLIGAAEQRVWTAGADNVVLRCSGIYGPGRRRLLDMARQAPCLRQAPPYYTNRIHEQDCVGVLAFLLAQRLAGRPLARCYLASDDYPAAQWEVVSWLAGQLGCPPPIPMLGTAGAGQNKRCVNRRLRSLGYQFVYPDYRAGYRELITHG